MGKQSDSLGDIMKSYENVSRNYLTRRIPVIIRINELSEISARVIYKSKKTKSILNYNLCFIRCINYSGFFRLIKIILTTCKIYLTYCKLEYIILYNKKYLYIKETFLCQNTLLAF